MAHQPAHRAASKTRSVLLTYEAQSFPRSGEVDRAAAAAHEALTTAARIGAPCCVALVHDLVPAFTNYRSTEGVPELLELARAS
ncbi:MULTISPECIES: hypothetical protein [Streptomyces]|uniref:Isochorismatase family protein n=1 Tax=Streptomyces ehimensis TaxID=68195 RepID=A0ABV9BIT1_9ACTN